jgi:chaperonin cofactor prefoldin
MKATRQLDDVFYSILEKVSVLQSTISNLQELSSLTGKLHEDFKSGAGSFESETQEQIDAFGGFHDPKQRIGSLEIRVKSSKVKADELSARLEAARARVQKLEAEESEYQATISRMSSPML